MGMFPRYLNGYEGFVIATPFIACGVYGIVAWLWVTDSERQGRKDWPAHEAEWARMTRAAIARRQSVTTPPVTEVEQD